MTLTIIVDEPIIKRASFVPKEFICTDCAIALVLKELFQEVHVFDRGFGFTNKDGHEVWTELPYSAQDWIKEFDRKSIEERKQMNGIRFDVELSDLAVSSVGEFTIKQKVRESRNLILT